MTTPIAIVGVGAVLPGAPDAPTFWNNVKTGVYSIAEIPPDRWDPRLYFDPDPKAPDKTYSKIGGFVRDFTWDPVAWHLPVPPKVGDAMDRGQKWAIACAREALADYGLDKPWMKVKVTFSESNKEETILFGQKNKKFYAGRADSPSVFELAPIEPEELEKKLKDLSS